VRRRYTAAWILSAGIVGQACAQGQSCTPYPEAFAQTFYRDAYAFFNESPERLGALVTPQLMGLLKNERRCVEQHGNCHLRYDPWLGAGGGNIGYPLQFHRESQDTGGAVVAVSYPLHSSAAEATRTATVRLELHKAVDSGCWQLQDFVTPDNDSLATLLDY
jgi:hypothetical protein